MKRFGHVLFLCFVIESTICFMPTSGGFFRGRRPSSDVTIKRSDVFQVGSKTKKSTNPSRKKNKPTTMKKDESDKKGKSKSMNMGFFGQLLKNKLNHEEEKSDKAIPAVKEEKEKLSSTNTTDQKANATEVTEETKQKEEAKIEKTVPKEAKVEITTTNSTQDAKNSTQDAKKVEPEKKAGQAAAGTIEKSSTLAPEKPALQSKVTQGGKSVSSKSPPTVIKKAGFVKIEKPTEKKLESSQPPKATSEESKAKRATANVSSVSEQKNKLLSEEVHRMSALLKEKDDEHAAKLSKQTKLFADEKESREKAEETLAKAKEDLEKANEESKRLVEVEASRRKEVESARTDAESNVKELTVEVSRLLALLDADQESVEEEAMLKLKSEEARIEVEKDLQEAIEQIQSKEEELSLLQMEEATKLNSEQEARLKAEQEVTALSTEVERIAALLDEQKEMTLSAEKQAVSEAEDIKLMHEKEAALKKQLEDSRLEMEAAKKTEKIEVARRKVAEKSLGTDEAAVTELKKQVEELQAELQNEKVSSQKAEKTSQALSETEESLRSLEETLKSKDEEVDRLQKEQEAASHGKKDSLTKLESENRDLATKLQEANLALSISKAQVASTTDTAESSAHVARQEKMQIMAARMSDLSEAFKQLVEIDQNGSAVLASASVSTVTAETTIGATSTADELLGTISPPVEAPTPTGEEVHPLIGKVVDAKYKVTEKIRVGTTKSDIFVVYHVMDYSKATPLILKLGSNNDHIDMEYKIHKGVTEKMGTDGERLIVQVYDKIEASPMTLDRAGFIMEKGHENLRNLIWRTGGLKGTQLLGAMEFVVQVVHALHTNNVVWTELKAENFIVFDKAIKGADFESLVARGDLIRAYTAEACPPEFPVDDMYKCLPKMQMDFSFDIWGLGLTLFEMATGKPLFELERTYDVDYIKSRLRDPEGIIAEANGKLEDAEPWAREVVQKCLVTDPNHRGTCADLLKILETQRNLNG